MNDLKGISLNGIPLDPDDCFFEVSSFTKQIFMNAHNVKKTIYRKEKVRYEYTEPNGEIKIIKKKK